MKKSLLLLLLIISIQSLLAQTPWTESGVRGIAKSGSERDVLTNCSMLTQEGYLYYGEILVDRLLEFQPENSNYNYRKGFMCLEIRRDYLAAIPFFQKASKNIGNNYDMYSTKEKTAPSDAYYHLAKCFHYNEQLDSAAVYYQKFIDVSRKKSELLTESQLRLKQIEVARQLMEAPIDVTLKNLGEVVNSEYPDYSSFVSFDGTALYFTSRRPWDNGESDQYKDPKINQYKEDIYVSYLDFDSSWTKPMRLAFCKPIRNEATASINTEERRVYLYQDTTGNGDIYFSDFKTNQFGEINFFEAKNINTDYWETHAMISPDGKTLIFASDRPGGFGKLDLYISKWEEDAWGKPENMGEQINGPESEDAPFISVDGKKLYFGTNDSRSIGGYDILLSELQEDGTWSTARNIGYPFNSTNDDLYYTTTVDGLTGYLTSYRENGQGEKDIYEIKNNFLGIESHTVLKGEVVMADGSDVPEEIILMGKVVCQDCDAGPINQILYARPRDHKFMTGLQQCKTYTLTYINAANDKMMGEETFTTECTKEYREVNKRLVIDPETQRIIFEEIPDVIVEDYKNLELKHFFGYNKNKFTVKRGELKDFVKEILEQLEDGRDKITVTIESSASNVPTRTYKSNDQLAKLRAENMKYELEEYFMKKNKTESKITIVISNSIVQGPQYEGDYKNQEKYEPFQYVFLKTE